MAKKNDYNYYDAFVEMVEYACQSAQMLHGTLTDFDTGDISEKIKEIHVIEHAGDICKHEMMNRLVKEFLPPIEREDIMQLAQEIDEVTDNIEDVMLCIYMYNIQSIHPEAIEFSTVITNCCSALKKAMQEFHNFRKSKTVNESIIEINRLEETGDKLYTETIRGLFSSSKDAVEIFAWTQTFDRFEKCCDACEHVADVMESIIMKNS